MAESRPRRKLAAILAVDVVGYSRMMGENEVGTLHSLKSCRAINEKSIENYHGRDFGTAGFSLIAEFTSQLDSLLKSQNSDLTSVLFIRLL